MESSPASAAPAPPAPPRRRRRLWIGIVVALAALAAGAVLIVRFGPQIVARHVVHTYLAGLNIDTSGVDTLRLRPLHGYLSFGPVTFRGADATMGQVGRIGVKVDVTRLLRRQALVESIAIEGVRFEVRQAADGAISLNGIPLSEILADATVNSGDAPPPPPVAPPVAPPAGPRPPMSPRTLQEELGWGAGLDLLEIRDSRVVFIDARGGEAVMQVDHLELGGFRTWAPDKPGHYRLDAELNDIQLAASGTAKPFADKIEIEGDAAVTGIEVTKIERYLGELGFTSRAGQIDLAVRDARVNLFTAGLVEARLAATGTMTGVNLAHPLFGSGQLATGTLRLDNVSGDYDASGRIGVSGDLGIDLQASELRLDDGTEVGFSRVTFGLPGTTVTTAPGQQPAVKVAPELDITALRLGGPEIRGSIGNTAVRLSGFNIDGTEPGSPFLATGSVAVDGVDLLLPQAEPMTIVADSVRVRLAETRLAFPPGRGAWIEGGMDLDTRKLLVSIQQQAVRGQPPPPPARIEAARLAFEIPALTFDDNRDTGTTIKASGPQLSFDGMRLGGPAVQGTIGHAAFRLSSFSLVGTQPGAPLIATGTVAMDRLDLSLPGVEPVAIAAEQIRAELAETHLALAAGAPSRIEGGIALDTRQLLVSIQEQGKRGQPLPPPTRIEAARLGFKVPSVAVDGGSAGAGTDRKPPGRQANAAAGTKVTVADPLLTLDRLRLGGPDIQGTVGTAVIRLSRVDVEAQQPGAPFVATGLVSAQQLDLIVPDIEPIGIAARQLDAKLIGTRFAFPSGRVLIEGGVALDTRELTVSIHKQAAGGGPAPPPMRIFATRFAGDVPKLRVDDSRATGTKVNVATPLLTLDRFRMEAPAKLGETLQLGASTLTLKGVDVDVVDAETLEVSGHAAVTAPDLSVDMRPDRGGSAAPGAPANAAPNARIGGLDLDLRHFSYREAGETSGFGMKGRIGFASLRGRLPPGAPGQPSGLFGLSGLRLDVADVDATMAPDGTQWRARLDFGLKSLTANLNTPLPLNAEVNDVVLTRFAGSSLPEYTLEQLTIGRFDASLIREAAAAPAPVEPPKPAEDTGPAERTTWPPADLPVLKIGRISLEDGGRISLLDETVSPAVVAAIDVETLSLSNVDSTNADARTDLRLKARVNDGSIRVAGWGEVFRAKPNFQLQANIDNLHLPAVSPYFAPQIGLDIFKGDLTVGAAGTVTEGQLDGRIQARIAGVRASDRPEAGTDRISREVGLPLSTLIRLLEDRDGAIDIALPVSGDILSPEFNTSGVIWDVLPRVLRALITSPVRFVSAAVSLIAASGSGDGGAAVAAAPAMLPPILFRPGEAGLSADARLALVGLQGVLKDNPQRSLTVCGHATAEDLAAMTATRRSQPQPQLAELAAARTRAVAEALTAGGAIAADRVRSCAEPAVDPAGAAPPRADLSF